MSPPSLLMLVVCLLPRPRHSGWRSVCLADLIREPALAESMVASVVSVSLTAVSLPALALGARSLCFAQFLTVDVQAVALVQRWQVSSSRGTHPASPRRPPLAGRRGGRLFAGAGGEAAALARPGAAVPRLRSASRRLSGLGRCSCSRPAPPRPPLRFRLVATLVPAPSAPFFLISVSFSYFKF